MKSKKQKFGNSFLRVLSQDLSTRDGAISSRRYLKAEEDVAKISGFMDHMQIIRVEE